MTVKHAKEIQDKAEAKYGKENVATIGHSLGAKLANSTLQNQPQKL